MADSAWGLSILQYRVNSYKSERVGTSHPYSSPRSSHYFSPHIRLFYRYQDLAPQLVPLDYTSCPDVKVPYELIGSMPELKVRLNHGTGGGKNCRNIPCYIPMR